MATTFLLAFKGMPTSFCSILRTNLYFLACWCYLALMRDLSPAGTTSKSKATDFVLIFKLVIGKKIHAPVFAVYRPPSLGAPDPLPAAMHAPGSPW